MPTFEFRSDFLVNLHHTLYYQAGVLQLLYSAGPDSLPGLPKRVYQQMTHYIPTEDQAQWYRALRFYQDEYGGRSLVFDDALNTVENALAAGVPPVRLKLVLDDVSPIYRKALWPIHDALNGQCIGQWKTALSAYGPALFGTLSRLYQRSWLDVPYRVDVVSNTDRDGAYSIAGKGDLYWHIVMSSFDRDDAGLHGFEIMSHEASHSIVAPDEGPIGTAIADACKSLDRPEPADLWHAAIMFLPGVVLQRLLSPAQAGGYVPAFVANGVFTQAYPRYFAAFQKSLVPYVEGRTSLQNAFHAVVQQVVAAG